MALILLPIYRNALTWLRSTRARLFVPFNDNINFHKVSVLPGSVISLVMLKSNGFKYKIGFLRHPFSITSASRNGDLSVHIRIVGDLKKELMRVFTKTHGDSPTEVDRDKYHEPERTQKYSNIPRLLVDRPYGAPTKDYKSYDVLLLVRLGIGATPFISILRDLLNNIQNMEDQTESSTYISRSKDSLNSFTSSSATPCGTKKSRRTTNAHFYWVTREPGYFEWSKGVMDEIEVMD
ncbi:hypothetical protein GIB67_016517 [Kingdonia uniflora]|uniref:FAD-binding FR-type domain-containing protein n=1 Tax=Kingdonia uniflora TaxID=39325 RepID=A0A7J7NQ55_9MAGN|nr:hypothetical protein GIB67_016517 [Kingdonia uniflora]